VSGTDRVRFRYHGALLVAGIIAFIGALPLATAAWYFTPVLLIPLAVTVWAWRAGTDADPAGLRVRALLGQRRVQWAEIAELGADPKGRGVALLRDGRSLPLPAVRAADLPRLAGVSSRQPPD